MQKITPFLWFNDNAEEAVQFYTSIFKDSSVKKMARYTKAGPGPEGSVMTAVIELNGQEFILLNGGPVYQFTEAVSFVVNCKTQADVDYYWDSLSGGGKTDRCGWLKDKFGLSWQVVPEALASLMSSGDPVRSGRVMQAMMQMKKIDVKTLEEAYEGIAV